MLGELGPLVESSAMLSWAAQRGWGRSTAYRLLASAVGGGMLARLRQGLYVECDCDGNSKVPAAYVATRMADAGVVSHWWAMELHGLPCPSNGYSRTVATARAVTTPSMRAGPKDAWVDHQWDVLGVAVRFTRLAKPGLELGRQILDVAGFPTPVMTPERALIACLSDRRFVGYLQPMINAVAAIGWNIDLDEFVRLSDLLGLEAVRARLGYILNHPISLPNPRLAVLRPYRFSGQHSLAPGGRTAGFTLPRWNIVDRRG